MWMWPLLASCPALNPALPAHLTSLPHYTPAYSTGTCDYSRVMHVYINENNPSSQLAPADGGDPNCAGRAPGCIAWPSLASLHTSGHCPLKNVSGGAFVVGCFAHESEKVSLATRPLPALIVRNDDRVGRVYAGLYAF